MGRPTYSTMLTWSAITPIFPGKFKGPEKISLNDSGKEVFHVMEERRAAFIHNPSSTTILLSPNEDVSSSLFLWKVGPGETFQLPSPIYTGKIYGCTGTFGMVVDVLVTSFYCEE